MEKVIWYSYLEIGVPVQYNIKIGG